MKVYLGVLSSSYNSLFKRYIYQQNLLLVVNYIFKNESRYIAILKKMKKNNQ